MERSPRGAEHRRAARGLVVLALLATAAGAHAHGDAVDGAPAAESGAGAFAAPAPGSYTLPALGPAADGRVLTSEAEPTTLHALFGEHVVLLSFIYTRCTEAQGCPLATAVLHRIGARVAAEPELSRELRLLSLSFDPERDTPVQMERYGKGFARAGLDWHFLTTESEAALAPLLAAYRQTRLPEVDESGAETGQFAHLLRVYLIDGRQRIRQVYSTSLLDPDAVIADVRTLLLESASGASGERPAGQAVAAAGRGEAVDLLGRMARPPLGLPPVPIPPDNPPSRAAVALGRRLFFDRRLSSNGTLSCAMCHVPEQGFTSNEMETAVGIEGRSVRRNSPTLYNAAYLERLFHDGRESRLEHQVWGPLLAQNEMGNPSIGTLLERLAGTDDYAERFEEAYPGRGLTLETLGMAIASYERTLVSGGSSFDRYRYGGDESALSEPAQRGLALFAGAAGCAGCHPIGADAALFTDNGFHNTGVGYAASMGAGGETPGAKLRVQAAPGVFLDVPRAVVAQVSEPRASDLGRYEITGDPQDRWRYRTPTLRNVALTAPYMHDGSLATLADVVDFYDRGGVPNEGLDPRLRPLGLSPGQKRDLVAFLESLTGDDVAALVVDAAAAPIGNVGSPGAARRAESAVAPGASPRRTD